MKQAGSRFSRVAGIAFATLMLAGAWSAHVDAAKRTAVKKSRAGADTSLVLVRIGRDAITRADVQKRIESFPEQFRSNYVTPEGRQQLVDRMIEERVWLSMAQKKGVADRPQVQQQLEQQRRDLLIRTYLNEVMAANTAPSDSEARVYYDAHLADYKVPATVTVRHIQSKTENDAKKVKQYARGKQDWAGLVKRFSTDTLTKANGGLLGTVTHEGVFAGIGNQPALAESAFALPEGGIGGPIKTTRGWHVIKVDALKPESTRPFDQVRQLIIRQLSSQRSQDFYKSRLEQARHELDVRPDSVAIKKFISQKKTAREMFNEAQALGTPDARLEGYRNLLAQYPDSEVSPQAQFMIGFIYSEELKNYEEAEKAFRALLQRYPKAELATSAQWMIDHMRSDEAPAFVNLDAAKDSSNHEMKHPNLKPWTPPAKKNGPKKP